MARLAIIAIVIAGFFLTGDVSSLVQGGRRLVRGIAGWLTSCQSLTFIHADSHEPLSAGEAWSGETVAAAPAAVQAGAAQPAARIDPSARPQSTDLRIPGTATNRVRVSDLRTGDRLVLWCGNRGAAGGLETLAIDLINPARGEALLTRQLVAAANLNELATAGGQTPQRVVLETPAIESGTAVSLRRVPPEFAVRPTGYSGPTVQPVNLGPVVAVQLFPPVE